MTTVTESGTVLDRIIARTRSDLEVRKQRRSVVELKQLAGQRPDPVDVAASLSRETVSIIAEIKRASPSRGRFPVEIDPGRVATQYAQGGASAISCLTDEPFFHGSLDDLDAVSAVAQSQSIPIGVLRKDFMIDPYQVHEARAHGASCILIIVACLSDSLMRELNEHAVSLGMSVLVEVHGEGELQRALSMGANLIGINNRDLKTLEIDINVTTRLARLVPPEVVLVGESGIFTQDHVITMAAAGVDAILVGESLILQDDRVSAVAVLTGIRKSFRDQP